MILVTGATGHIGNVLVRTLAEKDETVRVLVQKSENVEPLSGLRLDIFCGDIRNPHDVEKAVEGCDKVYHMAGLIDITPKKPFLLNDINITGTKNVVQACLKHNVKRLLYTSSVHALPEPPNGTPVRESLDFPRNDLLGAYARSKSEATAEVYKGVAQGLDAVIAFPTGVVGPYDFRLSEMGRVIRYIIRNAAKKSLMYFDGMYDFVDVRDLRDALISIMEHGEAGRGYIVGGHRMSVRDLFEKVPAVLGYSPKLVLMPYLPVRFAAHMVKMYADINRTKPFFTPFSIDVLRSNSEIDYSRIKNELGYMPRDVDETINDSVIWIKNYLSLCEKGKRARVRSVLNKGV